LVVDAGVAAFMGSGDWLLLTICVAFLFQGEKILRAIFNIKSAANTIGELATTAGTVAGMSKIIKEEKLFGKNDVKEEEVPKTTPPRAIPGNNMNPIIPPTNNSENNYDGNDYSESSSESSNNYSNTNNIDIQRIQNEVLKGAIESRNKHRKSRIGKYTQRTFRGAGMVTGLAAGMAVGKTSSVISNMAVGREIANTLSNAVTAPIRGVSNAYAGRKMKNAILNGEMDHKLGFDSDTTDDVKKASQDAYRKALAKMASTAARKGLDAGKAKFWSELE
jgi:hypothetical protein